MPYKQETVADEVDFAGVVLYHFTQFSFSIGFPKVEAIFQTTS